MAPVLRHGSARRRRAGCRGSLRRAAATGVRRHRADLGLRHLDLRTTAVREGDHYIINGQKIMDSAREHSDLLLLLARTTPRELAKKRTEGLSVFLVDMRLAQAPASASTRSAP